MTDCSRGLHHADCGGSGEPTLACGPDCLWFAGGCAAEGYVPIDCPGAEPFCVTTADGQWPFAQEVEFPESGVEYPEDWYFGSIFCDDLDKIGMSVVSATSGMNLVVTIDSDLVAPAVPEAQCDGLALGMCTADVALFVETTSFSETAVLSFRAGGLGFGDQIALELGFDDAGSWAGRAFARRDSDYWGWGRDCGTYLDMLYGAGDPRPVFAEGQIALSSEPSSGAELHGTATLRTAGDATLTLTF